MQMSRPGDTVRGRLHNVVVDPRANTLWWLPPKCNRFSGSAIEFDTPIVHCVRNRSFPPCLMLDFEAPLTKTHHIFRANGHTIVARWVQVSNIAARGISSRFEMFFFPFARWSAQMQSHFITEKFLRASGVRWIPNDSCQHSIVWCAQRALAYTVWRSHCLCSACSRRITPCRPISPIIYSHACPIHR